MASTSDLATDTLVLPRPKRVLIVGGGPSGLITLRNLSERGKFDEIKLVERRDDVGGVWCVHVCLHFAVLSSLSISHFSLSFSTIISLSQQHNNSQT